MAKRIGLFLLTNILVMVSISIILNLLGVRGYMTAYGIDYQSLMIYCLVWGMGGAFISLLMSRFMAKHMMGVQVIDPKTATGWQAEYVERVHRLAKNAGLRVMPEVGVYESAELNAFATGPSKSRSLVAVSTGLMERMDTDEIEGVLAHEISHVANGDMVTLTLIQGVVNAFAMFLARILAFAIAQAMRDRDERGGGIGPFAQMMMTMVFEMVFVMLGSIVVATFSRWREFRADHGGARLAGRESMVRALQKLQKTYEIQDPATDRGPVATLKISGHKKGFLSLFATHPPLETRIARLQGARAI